ncbi:hypothetical protein M3Y99_00465700 [Aphelenchoides fujianensis]|nr:hypothetical protein M3Y99_00465700 [Aphelenchoides fujianensis]
MWAMMASKNRKEASYQLMFLLACIHCIGLQTSGLFVGLWSFRGAVFCSQPTVSYVVGCAAVGSWCASTLASQILGINRCFVLYNRSMANRLFGGWQRVVWLSLPIVFFVWMCGWTAPPIFNVLMMAYVYDPHFGYFNDYEATYKNIVNTANNLFVACTESLIYGAMIVLYVRATRSASHEERRAASRDKRVGAEVVERIDSISFQFYVQVLLVGAIHFITALTHVVIQFFSVTNHPSVLLVASIFYLLSQGTPPLIYIAVNRSLRNQMRRSWRHAEARLFGRGSVSASSGIVATCFAPQQRDERPAVGVDGLSIKTANSRSLTGAGVNPSTIHVSI